MSTKMEWLDRHPKAKQWLWFIGLWFAGLISVATLTYPLKMLMNNLR